jgi:hypothetical protein
MVRLEPVVKWVNALLPQFHQLLSALGNDAGNQGHEASAEKYLAGLQVLLKLKIFRLFCLVRQVFKLSKRKNAESLV